MGFREQILALVAEDKRNDPATLSMLDALDGTLQNYGTDIKALKDKLRAKDGVSPEDFARLEAENAALQQKLSATETEAKKLANEHKKLGETSTKNAERLQTILRDDTLRKELVSANVLKQYMDAAHALLVRDVQVDTEKGEAFVMSKDKDGKETRVSVTDYVKNWSSTETGKAFVSAPNANGGGAPGAGKTNGTGKTMARSAFEALAPDQRSAFFKEGGKLVDE